MTEYPVKYFKNDFKVCSDEWCDRSFINSMIYTHEFYIERLEQDIKDDTEEIKKELEYQFHSNSLISRLNELIERNKDKLVKFKHELSELKRTDISDKEKVEFMMKSRDSN